MKNLLLMRHAKSSWEEDSLPDRLRPLNQRGRRDAPRMGKFLRDQGIVLDAILCSTAVRARETAEGFLHEYSLVGEVDYLDELYGADPEVILALLNQLSDEVETAMVIAHNPGLDAFLETICDQNEHMPTACVAHIKLPVERWSDLQDDVTGELLNFWKPREI